MVMQERQCRKVYYMIDWDITGQGRVGWDGTGQDTARQEIKERDRRMDGRGRSVPHGVG